MSIIKRLILCITVISLFALSVLLLTGCEYTEAEGGIIYRGTAVVGTEGDSDTLVIRDGTTIITSGSFSGNTTVKSLTIPDSVHTVEIGAFFGADNLIREIDGVSYVDSWAISARDTLTEISLREGTVGIGEEALSSLPSLKSLYIPDSVKYINSRAIYGAESLTEITLPFIGSAYNSTYSMHFGYIFGAFGSEKNADYVPESLTSVAITKTEKIFDNAFSECSLIENITLPEGIREIGNYAFSGASALKEIVIPDSVTRIGEHAFYNCYSLSNVTLPDNEDFKAVEQFTFAYCKSLEEVEIPESVDSIRACAFAMCEAMERLTLPDKTLQLIGQQAFNGCKRLLTVNINAKNIERGAFRQCKRLVSIAVADGCEKILGFAFEDCTEVKSIALPDSVTELGESVFKGCALLEVVNIPDGVEIIESQSFLNCSSLLSLEIPDSVKTIADTAFDGTPARIEEVILGVTYIDGWIVDVDASLTVLTLESDVRGIVNGVFDDCRGLKSIRFEGSADEWLALTERTVNSQLDDIAISYGNAE